MKSPRELQALYREGANISAYLRKAYGVTANTADIIETSYDIQTGAYTRAAQQPTMVEHKRLYSGELAKTILNLCHPESVLEAGVGEGTTLSGVLDALPAGVQSYGFDLSWSRVAYARRWLDGRGHDEVRLCTGNLFNIPFADNSVDVVFTSHAIEPNGGQEPAILKELYRVARRYLVLLEPGYEFADDEARQRMTSHGYCRNIPGYIRELGYPMLVNERFPHSSNQLNPTAITIVQKQGGEGTPEHILACPQFRSPLQSIGGMLFSREALRVYPVLDGIPCLRIENGILASKFEEVVGGL